MSDAVTAPISAIMSDEDKIRRLNGWSYESLNAFRDWRDASWIDCKFNDGIQWTESDERAAIEAGVSPLTFNHVFPIISMILGIDATYRNMMLAKGRTQRDADKSKVMSELMQFVIDQNKGYYKISQAFRDCITAGIGFLEVGFAADPRDEDIAINYIPWIELWWDPYASPWLDIDTCRYVMRRRWVDLEHLKALFPDKAQDLEDQSVWLADSRGGYDRWLDDQAAEIEEKIRFDSGTGSVWTDAQRKRVRPVEAWYPIYKEAVFARMRDGRVIEIDKNTPPDALMFYLSNARDVVRSIIPKIQSTIFLGNVILQDIQTPYGYDDYPFVPFVGYTDRENRPFGVPRQIKDPNIALNKRHSMMMALLKNQRIFVESDAVDGDDEMQNLYSEANKLDGFGKLRPGGLEKLKIVDNSRHLQDQIAVLGLSAQEIREISGVNEEQLGYSLKSLSGVAIERRQMQATVMLATLFDNKKRSLAMLGERIINMAQAYPLEKVIRITDDLTGSQRYAEVNKVVYDQFGNAQVINDLSEGRYDIVISDAPFTDTMREQFTMVIDEALKRLPEQAIAPILTSWVELQNLPNKEKLLERMNKMFGTGDEVDPAQQQAAQQQQQVQQAQMQMQLQAMQLDLQTKQLENQKIAAEIENLGQQVAVVAQRDQGNIALNQQRVDIEKERLQLEAIKRGHEMQHKTQQQQLDYGLKQQDYGFRQQDHDLKAQQLEAANIKLGYDMQQGNMMAQREDKMADHQMANDTVGMAHQMNQDQIGLAHELAKVQREQDLKEQEAMWRAEADRERAKMQMMLRNRKQGKNSA